jgi:hypothetical protein
MSLPPDFDETFDKITKLGITAENPAQIRDYLLLSIREVASANQKSDDLAIGDLGFLDWAAQIVKRAEDAIRSEVCQPDGAGLKASYKKVFESGSSDDNVKQMASLVTGILATINPSLAVSTVVVYFALWLSKVGLNQWCKRPV